MRRLFILLFLLVAVNLYATIDTRLTLNSNIYNSPEIGQGTLIIDVEAISNSNSPAIKVFKDAFKLDSVLCNQVDSIFFSEQLFSDSFYYVEEGFDSENGRIKYIYSYDTGIMSSISNDWLLIVRVNIVYNMIGNKGNISWYDGYPDYLVINSNKIDITGIEYPIPFNLMDISLPVTLNSFEGFCENKSIILKWVTESEINNVGFEILRANDGDNNYQTISSYKYNPELCGRGNSTTRNEYSFSDKSVYNEQVYYYKLIDIDTKGNATSHGPISVKTNFNEAPESYIIYQNHPNPFNNSTTIRFDIIETREVNVRVSIFNSLGQLVKVVYDGKLGSGSFEMKWYGINENGLPVPGGVYFATLQTDKITKTVRITLLK